MVRNSRPTPATRAATSARERRAGWRRAVAGAVLLSFIALVHQHCPQSVKPPAPSRVTVEPLAVAAAVDEGSQSEVQRLNT
jgi:hypothetical protein